MSAAASLKPLLNTMNPEYLYGEVDVKYYKVVLLQLIILDRKQCIESTFKNHDKLQSLFQKLFVLLK